MSSIAAPETLIHPDSLGDTLDSINAALFYDLPLSIDTRLEAAQWLANRQGLPHSYAGMFAPTAYDYSFGALTFTGESVISSAGTGHLLSEEACRVLNRIGISGNAEVDRALKNARRGILARLEVSAPQGSYAGVHCCGTCSAALWRHLASSGKEEDSYRMLNGLITLKSKRDGKGRWKQFPFYYTLLALSETNLFEARQELLYALPAIERALRRVEKSDPETEKEHERRRRIIMGRILENL